MPIVSARSREAPYWAWIRGTQAGWGERPLPFAVRVGDRVAVAIERARTGPRNLVIPDMVWPELGPWGAGSHEHMRPNGDTPVEMAFSWFEGQVVDGVCRHCGAAMTPRVAAAQRELHDRIRAWFESTTNRKAVTSAAAVRYLVDGMRAPSRPETSSSVDDA